MLEIHNQRVPRLRDWLTSRSAAELATLAQIWSLRPDQATTAKQVADAILRPEAVQQIIASLSIREREALERVQAYGGSIAAAILERDYGRVRYHGGYPNTRAYLMALSQPPDPTERLYLLGLLSILPEGLHHRYAIPPDLLELLPPVPARNITLELQPASEPPEIYTSEPRSLEHNLLVLLNLAQDQQLEVIPTGGLNKASLLRLARQWDPKTKLQGISREEHWPYVRFLRLLALGAGLIRVGADAQLKPTHEALDWMRLPALERAHRLLEGWIASGWDELSAFLGLKIEYAFRRDLAATKRALLRLIGQAPMDQWVSFNDFVAAVKLKEPDFARPDGDFDTWRITNHYRQPIDGFEHWDAVEGELLKAVAGGTLRWLGLTDLGIQGDEPISFRLNNTGLALLANGPGTNQPAEELLVIQPNFEVVVPAYASLYARFQLGRIAETVNNEETALYRLTKRSLQQALERRLELDEIVRFLEEQSGRALPQNVLATLREWGGQHGQVSLRRAALLAADSPVMLEQVKRDKRIRMPEVEVLNETTWIVPEGDAAGLAERLRKAGYGLSGGIDGDSGPLKEHDLTVIYAALDFYARACAKLELEHDASGALRKRVARLLPERQQNRAYQLSGEALGRLEEHLGKKRSHG